MKEGSIRERRPGVFEFRLYVGRDPVTNKHRWKSATWHGTKRASGKALTDWITDARKSKPGTTQTIEWLVNTWLDLQTDAGLSDDTIRSYRGYAKKWVIPMVGPLPIGDLTSGHLRELHAAMAKAGRRPSTIRQVHNIIRGSLTFGMEREWLDRNVAAIRRAPPLPPSEVVACTNAELQALLDKAGEPGSDLWTAIALGAALGRRLGQLCTIQHSGIDLDGGSVALRPTRKSPKVTTLPIDELTAKVLRIRLDWQQQRWERVCGLLPPAFHGQRVGVHPTDQIADPYLLSFVSDGSAPASTSYTRRFTTVRDELGMSHIHFHCLRHWCATTLINLGVPLPVVAERLGHSSPAVTARIYAHVVAGRHTEAAEMLGQAVPFGPSFQRIAIGPAVTSTKRKGKP